MKISSKLMIIVALTFFEISLTLISVFEITKGAKFHQLNSLHLKYSAELTNVVVNIDWGEPLDIPLLQTSINNVRQQAVECIEEVNLFNKFIMSQIGTYHAVTICEKDVEDANLVLHALDKFIVGAIEREVLLDELIAYVQIANTNSALFEKPITETVTFVVSTMVPLVVIISVFNMLFISYISRTISGSIHSLIKLLSSKDGRENIDGEIHRSVSGELKLLLEVSKERLTQELLVSGMNKKLETLVEWRTQSLTRANEELAQFAYRASHDLKAPLTSTKRLASFIAEDIEDGNLDMAQQDAQQIVQQMAKLENLVESILALTEADEAEQQVEKIDFTAILAEVKERTDALLQMHHCRFESSVRVRSPVFLQPVRVMQILENLVTNAIKYSDSEKKSSFVRVIVYQGNQDCIIEVEDNGLGIPENRKKEVFQMFKRFHPQVSSGSGLGMAIIKKHVDHLGGRIDMSTSPKGSLFTIKLPQGGQA